MNTIDLIETINLLLDYDSKQGEFIWKKSKCFLNDKNIGKVAGTINRNGYRIIRINSKNYRAHRLVWLMETKELPTKPIDHINRNKLDNKFSNLRLCTYSQNMYNTPKTKKPTTSKYKGVTLTPWGWLARVQLNNKKVYQEYFKSEKEAATAYKEKVIFYSKGYACVDEIN